MHHRTRCLAVLLGPLLALTACASDHQRAVRRLDDRLQADLAQDITAGNVALQKVPNGAQVVLLHPALGPANGPAVLDQQHDPRANIVEALLDPRLMQIQVSDASTLPDDQRASRIAYVTDYLTSFGLAPTLLPAVLPAATRSREPTAPPGLALTISVHCPPTDPFFVGYGSGRSNPVCD